MDTPRPPQLLMRRATLADLPALAIPEGFTLRMCTLDDLPEVARVLAAAFPETGPSLETVRGWLFEDPSVVAVYGIFTNDGKLAATASSRLIFDRYPDAGYVHWVGADPDQTGKGLGYQVTLAVLHDFAGRGLPMSVLKTDDFRVPAIRVYRRLGFVPEMAHESHAARWEKLRDVIGA